MPEHRRRRLADFPFWLLALGLLGRADAVGHLFSDQNYAQIFRSMQGGAPHHHLGDAGRVRRYAIRAWTSAFALMRTSGQPVLVQNRDLLHRTGARYPDPGVSCSTSPLSARPATIVGLKLAAAAVAFDRLGAAAHRAQLRSHLAGDLCADHLTTRPSSRDLPRRPSRRCRRARSRRPGALRASAPVRSSARSSPHRPSHHPAAARQRLSSR